MSPHSLQFAGKKVVIFGLGQYEHGSGISAAKFLLEMGAQLTVTDLKKKELLLGPFQDLEGHYTKLLKKGLAVKPIKYVFGQHRDQDFAKADWVLRNPSVPNDSKFLQLARANGAIVDTDISLFFRLCPARIIGITGTRGKSTTTTLIYEILKIANARTKSKVYLGGNILFSPLNFVDKLKPHDWVVLELSSWQTESLAPFRLSPHISVITNLYPDHLNAHGGMADYAAAKQAIFNFQTSQDFAIFNSDNEYTRAMAAKSQAQKCWFGSKSAGVNHAFIKNGKIMVTLNGKTEAIMALSEIKLIGEHNQANVMAASLAALAALAKPEHIRQAVKKFKGLPNRLELVRKFKGINFYNDTTATTADGTIAAIKSFKPGKVVLIAGGAEKNLPFDSLAQEIVSSVKNLILLKHPAYAASERIAKEIAKINPNYKINWAESMAEAVNQAIKHGKKGDTIIMSPACASFGLFKNEFDRGDQFVAAVKSLKSELNKKISLSK